MSFKQIWTIKLSIYLTKIKILRLQHITLSKLTWPHLVKSISTMANKLATKADKHTLTLITTMKTQIWDRASSECHLKTLLLSNSSSSIWVIRASSTNRTLLEIPSWSLLVWTPLPTMGTSSTNTCKPVMLSPTAQSRSRQANRLGHTCCKCNRRLLRINHSDTRVNRISCPCCVSWGAHISYWVTSSVQKRS